MNVRQLAEAVCAVHLSSRVEGSLDQRGGMFLVGPPGVLKSTMADTLGEYPDALVLSDVNVSTLTALRDTLAGGSVRTLVFPEFPKIYERHVFTAYNVEGTLRAMASEGFSSASFEDHRVGRRKAVATIVGAMQPQVRDKHFSRWEGTGFSRRFLWCLYGIDDSRVLDDAAAQLRRLDFHVTRIPRLPPFGQRIPNLLTPDETERAKVYVAQQPGGTHTQQVQILVRVWAVLKWWHAEIGTPDEADKTVRAFAKSLRRDGTDLEIQPQEQLYGATPAFAAPVEPSKVARKKTGARTKRR